MYRTSKTSRTYRRRRVHGILSPMRALRKLMICILILLAVAGAAAYGISAHVVSRGGEAIVFVQDANELTVRENAPDSADAVLVLGAGLNKDGTPSPMLKDRLDLGISLYRQGYAPKLLLSGDNGQEYYNEVKAMLDYAVSEGVPMEDIFCDYAGFSTYDSVYRARDIFCVEKVIIVTQQYHLYRALHGCRAMGIEALGAGADQQKYAGREMRELREVLARDKDLVKWGIRPAPTFLGDPIAITGDGTGTH